MPYTIAQIAELLAANFNGDANTEIKGIAPIESAGNGDLTHLSSAQYTRYLKQTKASAILVHPDKAADAPCASILTEEPYVAYAKASRLFSTRPRVPIGIHETAFVDASANIGDEVRIGPFVSVGAECEIGDGVEISANAVVEANVTLRKNVVVRSNAVIAYGSFVGAGSVLGEGCVIGAEGFGYAQDQAGLHYPIAQLGRVHLGEDVEVGAKSTIDRGALTDTVVEDGVKMDDQVHIGHNCHIGEHTLLCGCVGLAGSTTVGKHCMLGGGVGVAGDGPLNICDRVLITACTFVSRDITEPGMYSGNTLHSPTRQWRRNALRWNQVTQLARRVRELETSATVKST